MLRQIPAALFIAIVCLLAVPAASGAAVVAGSIEDGPGEGTSPQHDIRTAALVYDTAGNVRGAVNLAEAPVFPVFGGVEFGLGAWSKKTGACHAAADVSLFPPEPDSDFWFATLTIGDADDGPTGVASSEGSTVTFEMGAPEAVDQKWNCARLATFGSAQEDFADKDATEVFSLTAGAAQNPDAAPACAVKGKRVRRGKKARMRCSNVRGRLTMRVYRRNKLVRTAKAKVTRGRVTVSTRRLRRGRYLVAAWSGDTVVGHGEVSVR